MPVITPAIGLKNEPASRFLISFVLLMFGGTMYYLNEEYPEKATLARFGLGITVLGLLVLGGSIIFLRQWTP